MLDRVHLHYNSMLQQVPNQSKLRIANKGTQPMYINYQAQTAAWPQTLLISPGQVADYDIPSGSVPATRFWPKYDCDSSGQNCTFGESGGPNLPCPKSGCSPPVDSKFEATFGASGNLDWYDSSQVDGWSLPYYMEFNCDGDPNNSGKLNCQSLTESVCPSQDVQGAGNVSLTASNPDKGGKYAGCYSPCALLTYTNWGNPYAKYVPD